MFPIELSGDFFDIEDPGLHVISIEMPSIYQTAELLMFRSSFVSFLALYPFFEVEVIYLQKH